MIKRVFLALAALATIAVPALAAGSASAAPARAPESVILWTANGNQNAIGWNSDSPGTMVIQVITSARRTMTFSNDGGQFLGDTVGTLQTAGGNFVAANTACNGVTIKDLSSSFGTAWTLHMTGGHVQLTNRGCSQQPGTSGDRFVAYANNVLGVQWKFCDLGPIDVTCGSGKFWNLDFNIIG